MKNKIEDTEDEEIQEFGILFNPRKDIGLVILLFLSQHEVRIDDNTVLPCQDYIFGHNFIQTAYGIDNTWVKTSFLLYPTFENVRFSNGNKVTEYDIMKILIQNHKDELNKDSYLIFSKIVAELDHAETEIIPVSTNYAPSNKFAQLLPVQEMVGIGLINYSINKKQPELFSWVEITQTNKNIKYSKQIEIFDMAVMSAITSIYLAGTGKGKKYKSINITPQMVYKNLTGSTKRPSAKILKEINQSIEKQMTTVITIDYSDELKSYKMEIDGEKVTAGDITGMMLPALRKRVLAGGSWITGYEIIGTPILYTYANIFNQISSYPSEYLGLLTDKYSDTKDRISIRYYLLNRILGAKNGKLEKTVYYKKIFEDLGLSNIEKTQQARHRKFIEDYLTELSKKKFLKVAEYQKKNSKREIIGFRIDF